MMNDETLYDLAIDSTQNVVAYHVKVLEKEGELYFNCEALLLGDYKHGLIYSFLTDFYKVFVRFGDEIEFLENCIYWPDQPGQKITVKVLKIDRYFDSFTRNLLSPTVKRKSNNERLGDKKLGEVDN